MSDLPENNQSSLFLNQDQKVIFEPYLLYDCQPFQTNELKIAKHVMSELYVSHKLKVPVNNEKFGLKHERITLGEIQIGSVYYSADTLVSSLPLEDFYLIQFAVQSTSEVHQNGVSCHLKPGDIYVFNPKYPVDQIFHAGSQQINIRIGVEQLERFFCKETNCKLTRPLEFKIAAMSNEETSSSLLNFIYYLISNYKEMKVLDFDKKLDNYFEEMLIMLLLNSVKNNYREFFFYKKPVPCPLYLRKAIDFIEGSLQEELTVEDIAKAIGVSVSSLFSAFRKYKETTPSSYLKNRRLELAYDLLKKSSIEECSVTEIAISCGFNHLGRFSSEYKKKFNELPSFTLRDV